MARKRGTPVRQLRELARLYGVQTSYYDIIARRRRHTSPEALRAVLRALGAPLARPEDVRAALRERRESLWQRGLEPVAVAWEGAAAAVELRLPAELAHSSVSCHLELETGDVQRWGCNLSRLPTRRSARLEGTRYVAKHLSFPKGLPRGYHGFTCETQSCRFSALIISAPVQAYTPPDTRPNLRWGVFLPLYALHSRRSWAGGDPSDMEDLMEWLSGLGGNVFATLPLLAAFLDEPFDPSPYAPVSRLFWNEFYLDVARIPELEHCAGAQEMLGSPEIGNELEALRASARVDYRRGMALKRSVLEKLARGFFAGRSQRIIAFQEFVASHSAVEDYARFRAVCERRRTPWPTWPQPLRDGLLRQGDCDEEARRYHLYVQWLADGQLRAVSEKARRRNVALYLDYPVGVHPAGYDTWRERDVFLHGFSTGAPPDNLFTRGQKWGSPPLHPERIRQQGYRYYIASLRHQLRHAGIFRIDHVMGLHRLFWVPPGLEAPQGVYVRYRAEEFYAILALESHRHKVLLVGEDLGRVPRAVRPTMARHKVHRMYVAQSELTPNPRRALRPIPSDSVATLNTHDMPTFASFWEGQDIDERTHLGLLDKRGAAAEHKKRRKLQKALVSFLRRHHWLQGSPVGPRAALRAWLARLGASRARVVIVNLEDLWLEEKPQNVPGTAGERPNWRRKTRHLLEELCRMQPVLDILKQCDQGRKQARWQ